MNQKTVKSLVKYQSGSASVEALVFIPILLALIVIFADVTSYFRLNDGLQQANNSLVRAVSIHRMTHVDQLKEYAPQYLLKVQQLLGDPEGNIGLAIRMNGVDTEAEVIVGICSPPMNPKHEELPINDDFWLISLCYQPSSAFFASSFLEDLELTPMLISHAVFRRR